MLLVDVGELDDDAHCWAEGERVKGPREETGRRERDNEEARKSREGSATRQQRPSGLVTFFLCRCRPQQEREGGEEAHSQETRVAMMAMIFARRENRGLCLSVPRVGDSCGTAKGVEGKRERWREREREREGKGERGQREGLRCRSLLCDALCLRRRRGTRLRCPHRCQSEARRGPS